MKEIPLHYRQRIVTVSLVDDADFEELSEWRWSTNYVHFMTDDWGYAFRGTSHGSYAMARHIMGIPHGDPRVVHHVNETRLDNRRENLLVCASKQEHLMIQMLHAAGLPASSSTIKKYLGPWSEALTKAGF